MTSADCPIRAMRPEDLPAAIALWKETEGVGLSPDETLELLAKFLARNPEISAVAIGPDGQIAGAVLGGYDGRRAYLYHMSVRREFRGRGIARALANHVLAGLKAAGMAKCSIVVYADNAEGHAFWHHLGWSSRTDLAIHQIAL